MAYKNITYTLSDGVAELTFARDDIRNSMSRMDFIEDVCHALDRAEHDKEARVLILAAEGHCFSAGGNLKDLRDGKEGFAPGPVNHRQHYFDQIQLIPRALHKLTLPTIAAVQGPAIGGGCDIAAYCDIILASTKATFCEMFVNLGLIPGTGGAWLMPRRVGWQAAADLLFTGRVIDGLEAKEMGLAHECLEPDALMPRAREIAQRIASRPPLATRMIKILMKLSASQTLPDMLDNCASYQGVLQSSEDHATALAATLEHQPDPKFSGR